MRNTFFILVILVLFSFCKKEKTNQPSAPGVGGGTIVGPPPTYHNFALPAGTNDNSALITSDNNLIVCGNSSANASILKISKTGSQIWRKDIFLANNTPYQCSIAQATAQELYICGIASRNLAGKKYDLMLTKTNSTGDTLWTKYYGGTENEFQPLVITTSDGNVLIAGKTESFGAGTFGDIYVVKVNINGDTLWTRTYPDQDQEVPFHLMETQNGEYLVTGTNEDNSNPRELYLLKINSNGAQVWNKKIGPATYKWGYSTVELSNGDLVTCGSHNSTGGYSQVLLVKTDHLGNVIWEKEFGDPNISEFGYSMKQSSDGTFVITGGAFDVSTSLTDAFLLKVDADGIQMVFKKFGSTTYKYGSNILKDNNGDNIIIGSDGGAVFMTRTDNNCVFK